MKPHERIPIFLKLIDWDKFVYKYYFDNDKNYTIINTKIKEIQSKLPEITYTWTLSPNLRIGQLLINMNILPHDYILWDISCNEILKQQGVDPIKYTLWGSFGKNNEFENPQYKLIPELETEHIKNILKTQTLSFDIGEMMKKELDSRTIKEDEVHVDIKQTIWTRYYFDKGSDVEKITKEVFNDSSEVVSKELGFSHSEALFDTIEALSIKENGNYSTIEVFKNNKLYAKNN
jgi:hypothetical protein